MSTHTMLLLEKWEKIITEFFWLLLCLENSAGTVWVFKPIAPIALKMAKTPLSFGHSECNGVNESIPESLGM